MTTTEPTTALATREGRELSDDQIKRRLQLSKSPGFGLQNANPAQLEMVFLLCRRYQLDPLTDVTLYEGKPWLTLDGRVRLMRRHPEYRGYRCRPLSRSEKEEWGYEADDIIVECTVRTTTWGDISARGKVSRAELEGRQARSNPVAKVHPVEMAEKRAIARAERAAFGQDAVLDEEEAQIEIIEQEARNTPERRAALAATYQRVMGSEEESYYDQPRPREDGPASSPAQGEPLASEGVPTASSDAPAVDDPAEVEEALAKNAALVEDARSLDVKGLGPLTAKPGWSLSKIQEASAELSARIRSRNGELDEQVSRESAAQAKF